MNSDHLSHSPSDSPETTPPADRRDDADASDSQGSETPMSSSSEPTTTDSPTTDQATPDAETTTDAAATDASSAADGASGEDAANAEAPRKKLSAGRAASAKGGPTLKGAGVATMAPIAGGRVEGDQDVSEDARDPGDEAFDPAVDLPMYRPGMDWFVLRVASNKESYVRETLLKKVEIEGLAELVGRIMVPTEKTKTLKGGKTRIVETKLYPGYVFVEMALEADGRIPQDVFFLIKETTGVGDFVGTAGHPTPMGRHEVEKMLFDSRRPDETPSVKMEFESGDHVLIKEGPFENYEGTVDEVLPDKGLVRVLVTIFGRQAPIELQYWQISKIEN